MKASEYRGTLREHDIQKTVLAHLGLFGKDNVFAFAIPNAGWRPGAIGSRMKAEGLTAGVADLAIMLPAGKVAWLELKARRGRQSEAQKAFEAVCHQLGHPYAMARGLDEAIDVLKGWGALK
jgi:hypothetical protein